MSRHAFSVRLFHKSQGDAFYLQPLNTSPSSDERNVMKTICMACPPLNGSSRCHVLTRDGPVVIRVTDFPMHS